MQVNSSNGCVIEVQDFGGEGPDLLISHATGFHGSVYAPMAKVLRKRFRVWALDFRGHGLSPAPADGNFAWDGMGDDVLACIDAIGVDSILGFGHSLGGAATLLAELKRPGTIRAAYLFEPIVFPKEFLLARADNPMSAAARRRREVFASRAEALERYSAKAPLGRLRADALSEYVQRGFEDLDDGTVRLRCRAESEARSFEAEDKVTIDRMSGLNLPLTVGAGTLDPNNLPGHLAPGLVAAVKGAKLVEHPFLTHFGPMEAPDVIAADVIEALSTSS